MMAKPYYQEEGIPWGEGWGIKFLTLERFEAALKTILKRKLMSLGSPIGDYILDMALYFDSLKKDQFNLAIDQIKTVIFFGEEALGVDPQKCTEAYEKISHQYMENQEQVSSGYYNKIKTKSESNAENIQNILECYHLLYEQGYKILITFPIVCKDIYLKNSELKSKSIREYINDDPSYKIKKIKSGLIIKGFQTNILLNGYDNHIRNAVSHRHIKIPDPDKPICILKDKEWKRKFTFDEILDLVKTLWITLKALEVSLSIFYINNYETINQNSTLMSEKPNPTKIRDILYTVFNSMGFDIVDLSKDEDFSNISIKAKIKPLLFNRFERESELIFPQGGVIRKIKIPSIDFSVKLRDNALGALLRSHDIFPWFKNIKIEFINQENKSIALIKCKNPEKFFDELKNCTSKNECDRVVEKFKLYTEAEK